MWLRQHEKEAEAIAQRGDKLIRELLKPENVIAYVTGVLQRYKRLFAASDGGQSFGVLFEWLCGGGVTCSRYNASHPPPRFAGLSGSELTK